MRNGCLPLPFFMMQLTVFHKYFIKIITGNVKVVSARSVRLRLKVYKTFFLFQSYDRYTFSITLKFFFFFGYRGKLIF